MAHQEDYHRQIHYASILPSNTNEYNHHYHHNPHMHQRSNEQERTKALYVDFEDAFQDDTTTNDYFGFQLSQLNSHPTTNNLQSQFIETISEVTNNHFSPYIRYQVSRESSRPSTPSDTPPYQPRYNHLPISTNLNRDFTNLNLMHSNDNNNIPAPFTPDAIRFKIKQQQQQQEIILPQYFLVKYLGRTSCTQLWGAKAVRTPIDDMVRSARQLPSMNEIPTLEICVNIHGLTLTHRNSSTRNKHQHSRNHSPERHQHGLIPLDNISYAMHDVKYSKIASCIVLRQLKILSNDHKNASETLTECYAFLFQTKDHAHRFALAIAEAFNLQNQPTRMPRQQQQHDNNKREGRSPPRRSKHRNIHHRTHNTSKYNGNHLRDSKA